MDGVVCGAWRRVACGGDRAAGDGGPGRECGVGPVSCADRPAGQRRWQRPPAPAHAVCAALLFIDEPLCYPARWCGCVGYLCCAPAAGRALYQLSRPIQSTPHRVTDTTHRGRAPRPSFRPSRTEPTPVSPPHSGTRSPTRLPLGSKVHPTPHLHFTRFRGR